MATSTTALNVPLLIFDYRLVSPAGDPPVLRGPLSADSGFPTGVIGNAGMWGAELTYQWLIPIKPPMVLILNPFAGYGRGTSTNSPRG